MDVAVQMALVAFLILVALMSVSGTIYWFWWLRRLSHRENIRKFIETPIPGLRRARVAGQEVDFAADIRDTTQAERETASALEALDSRIVGLEDAARETQELLIRMEDVSGRFCHEEVAMAEHEQSKPDAPTFKGIDWKRQAELRVETIRAIERARAHIDRVVASLDRRQAE